MLYYDVILFLEPVCCCFFYMMFIMVTIFSGLYWLIYTISPPPQYNTALYVVPHDYVKIEYEEEKTYDRFIGRSVSVSTDDSLIGVFLDVYQTNCKDVNSDQYTKEHVSELPFVISECIWRCEIDKYLYFVDNQQSVLSYNITMIHTKVPSIKGRVVLFDDYSIFASYLNGSDEETGIVQQVSLVLASNASNELDFTFSNMGKSSYYFVAFEELNQNLTRIGFMISGIRLSHQVIYDNIDSLTFTCLDICNDMGLYKDAHKQCFFLEVTTLNVLNPPVPVYFQYGYDETITTFSIIGGGVVTAVGCCCLCACLCCISFIWQSHKKRRRVRALNSTDDCVYYNIITLVIVIINE